jgi:exodeoxyribonuclease VII small subunit
MSRGERERAANLSTPDLSLEQALARLDAIVNGLERDDLELDEALRLFEEGIAHVRQAQKIIAAAELRIERLVEERGQPQVEPMKPPPERP